MVERGVAACSMEVSSHALALHRVDGVVFDVAGFTNLSQDHLDFHPTMADYFAAKAELFTPARARRGVVCVDDEWGRRLAALSAAAGVPVTTVSTLEAGLATEPADWRVTGRRVAGAGTDFTITGPDGVPVPARCPLPGDFNVANTAVALLMLVADGIPAVAAAGWLAEACAVPGRMEPVRGDGVPGEPLAVVDYAHSPDAVTAAVRALRAGATGPLVVVLGAGGDRDREKRPLMGAAAAAAADVVVVTDDNPRGEDPAAIRAAVVAGARASGAGADVVEIGDRAAAIAEGVRRGLGRGHAAGRRQGPRDRTGGRRRRAPLRRPHRAGPGAARGPPGTRPRGGSRARGDSRARLDGAAAAVARDGGPAVIPLTLAEVADAVSGRLDAADPATVVTGGVTADSRLAGDGGLFVALPGEHADGHDYAAAAVGAGAAAVLAARPVGVPAVVVDDPLAALGRLARAVLDRLPQVTVVGVTGSSGKTSTKDLLAAVLAHAGPTVAPQGSFNNELGVPLTVLRADPGTRFLVAEMGARGIGHIAYLCGIAPPRIGVVLNVGAAHAGEFGGREATARAKGELVEALPADGVAVLNADDPLVAAMAGRTRARVVTVGSRADGATVRAADVALDDAARAAFRLVTPAGEAEVRLALHGAHHVGNALAAAAVGLEAGLGPAEVAAALSAATPASRWRMEVATRADGVTVVNDAYNANPDSVRAALAAVAAMTRDGAQAWAVLGEMLELGDETAAEHRAVGEAAAGLGIEVVAVGAGAHPAAAGAVAAGGAGQAVADPAAAAALLAGALRPGDVVLVKASRGIGLDVLAAELLGTGAGRPLTLGTVAEDGVPVR
jgi:UDP-N-acetylmuramoyl-tripeptide--D-alanyl-D-alanine ligase